MAIKIDKELLTKANSSKDIRALFQRGIEYILSQDTQGLRSMVNGLTNTDRLMLNLCVGKDGNTLVHRLFSGIVSSDIAIDMVETLTVGFQKEMLNLQNAHGLYPIHMAVEGNITFLIDYLIENKADLNKKHKTTLNTPALIAAINGDMDLLKKLAIAGANITSKDLKGFTCEHYIIANLGDEAARQWSVLLTLQSVSAADLLIQKDEEVPAVRSARAL